MTQPEIRKAYRIRQKAKGLCSACPNTIFKSLYCETHYEKQLQKARIRNKKIKEECIQQYGNKCACCNEDRIRFLTIDHKNGGGNKHRLELFKFNVGGAAMYRWLKQNNYPLEFQVLCMNCNFATRYGENCPHMEERM